ncbi:zinc-binding alcohol dehydrogenase [Flagellimonas sp. GZD32]|uniref:zinc-binding alcohol dehydrogenase n=1 Tax=Flagellimonas cixiensis TaxID=3228750 RepID=UPI0035C8AFB5
MKVKEIPVSLYNQIKLSGKPLHQLISNKEKAPVVVSLASIPSRLNIVHLTIRSILNQTILPEHLILWLHQDLKNQVPKKLSVLEGDIFQIRYTDYFSSHRKLVEPLKLFPEKTIITCDDDMMYRDSWLSNILSEHQNNPNTVIANQVRCISYDDSGALLPYKEWKSKTEKCENPKLTLPIGAGGTLYPSNCLHEQVLDKELFLKLTPKADDLWFKAMSLIKGTPSQMASIPTKEPIPIWGSQKVSLKKGNIGMDKNRDQWLALSEHFKFKF